MLLIRIVGVAMTALILSMVFKKQSPATALAIAASGGVMIILMLWEPLVELLKALEYFGDQAQMPDGYLQIVIKAIGITLLCELAHIVVEEGLSVRQLEELLRKKKSARPQVVDNQPVQAEFTELEDKLMRALGTRVVVKGNLDKGRIILEYFQRDDLERIYEIATQLTSGSE